MMLHKLIRTLSISVVLTATFLWSDAALAEHRHGHHWRHHDDHHWDDHRDSHHRGHCWQWHGDHWAWICH